jgi:hypothetical protein
MRVGPAVVPGRLDQQAAGVGVPGLGDPARGPGGARGVLRGTSPRYAPIVLPLKRFQSPISTASPTAVSTEIPRRHIRACTTGAYRSVAAMAVILESSRFLRSSVSSAVPGWPRTRPAAQGPRTVAGEARCGGRRFRPGHPSRPRPWRSRSFETRCLARIRSARTSSRARTRSRAASCEGPGTRTGVIWPSRANRAQMLGVPGVGFHPVPGGSLEPGRRRDHALEPCRGQYPGQSEPRGTCFIDHQDRAGNRATRSAIPASLAARLWRRVSPVSRSIAQPFALRAWTSKPT